MSIMGNINRELLFETTNNKALSWLTEPMASPYPEHAVAAAKCWLTYRFVEGKLNTDAYHQVVAPAKFAIANPSHQARWAVSCLIARAYVSAKYHDAETVAAASTEVPNDWGLWMPSAVNVIRIRAMAAYAHYLNGRSEDATREAYACEHPWSVIDRKPWMSSVLDTLAAGHAIMASRVILYKAGVTTEPMGGPRHPRQVINRNDRMDFERALVRLGELNPAAAIWTYADLA